MFTGHSSSILANLGTKLVLDPQVVYGPRGKAHVLYDAHKSSRVSERSVMDHQVSNVINCQTTVDDLLGTC